MQMLPLHNEFLRRQRQMIYFCFNTTFIEEGPFFSIFIIGDILLRA